MSFTLKFHGDAPQPMRLKFGQVPDAGTGSYNSLLDKPRIEGKTLIGDKSFQELGLDMITPQEIDEIIFGGG